MASQVRVSEISQSKSPGVDIGRLGLQSKTGAHRSGSLLEKLHLGRHNKHTPDARRDSPAILTDDKILYARSTTDDAFLAATPSQSTYTFERYIARAILNTLGPCLFTALYLFIVFVYLLRPAVDDIVPNFPISARGVFYAWLILSIFALDWARAGLAGFEGSFLMKESFAPRNGMQLMWHADRSWGAVGGWWKALGLFCDPRSHGLNGNTPRRASKRPSRLWWYLSATSFLFYAAVPLAGLSMDRTDGLQVGNRRISILGTNETTFDLQFSNGIAERARSRWQQGNPTTPHGQTIFYAPAEVQNASSLFYEDTIQGFYNHSAAVSSVAFFSGPQVSERAHGRAWGLLTNLSCSIVHPYSDMRLLRVRSIDNWTAPNQNSLLYSQIDSSTSQGGLFASQFDEGSSFGVDYKFLISSDLSFDAGSDYLLSSSFPTNGSLELVMWQAYAAPPSLPDPIFQAMSSHPSVASSVSPSDNATYLGYAISCSVDSAVGFASLDAATHTYSEFSPSAALPVDTSLSLYSLNQYPGVLAIQSLVYSAFTTSVLTVFAPPTCDATDGLGSITCNPWYSANVATGGSPMFVSVPTASSNTFTMQYPTLSPERMKLAIHKLFGEVAVAVMASGPGNWTGELQGLDYASDLIPGTVPWQVVVVLLGLWTLMTVLPGLGTLVERRWAETLGGFEMFRLGAEWTGVVRRLDGRGFEDCEVLREIPGMVGDMEPGREKGFIGLSSVAARRDGRMYMNDRQALE